MLTSIARLFNEWKRYSEARRELSHLSDRELADIGVTDNIVIPWVFDGLSFDAPLEKKKDSLKRFADTYIHSGWQNK